MLLRLQDNVFLSMQDRQLHGPSSQHWSKAYYMPAPCDQAVVKGGCQVGQERGEGGKRMILNHSIITIDWLPSQVCECFASCCHTMGANQDKDSNHQNRFGANK